MKHSVLFLNQNKKVYLYLFVVLFFLGSFFSLAFADDEVTLQESEYNPFVIYGEDVSFQHLPSRVVVVHLWSSEDPTSRAETSTLSRFYKKNKSANLMVLGAYAPLGGENADYASIWKDAQMYRIAYPLLGGFVTKKKVTRIPHTFVFDVGGKLVFDGDDTFKCLRTAASLLKKYPKILLGDRKPRTLSSEYRQFLTLKRLGRLHLRLQKILEKENREDKREDAKYLISRIDEYFSSQRKELSSFKKLDPINYERRCKEFILDWKGHEQVLAVEDEKKSLAQDELFKQNLESAKLLKKVLMNFYTMKPTVNNGVLEFSDPKFKRKNARKLKELKKYCNTLIDKYPTTPFKITAESILKQVNSESKSKLESESK